MEYSDRSKLDNYNSSLAPECSNSQIPKRTFPGTAFLVTGEDEWIIVLTGSGDTVSSIALGSVNLHFRWRYWMKQCALPFRLIVQILLIAKAYFSHVHLPARRVVGV